MSNIFSFFGQEIKTGAPQSFEIPFGEVVLHLSTVSLAKDTPKGSITRVYVHSVEEGEEGEEQKDNKYVICTLVGKEKESVTIDLNFSEDLALSLETTAGVDTTVHVTGYINLIGDEEEGDLDDYGVINTDGNESDEEVKTKLLQKMLEEEDDSEDEDFHPDLNESTESAKLEELSDDDEEDGEEIEDSVAEEVMRRVTVLEDKLGREATDNEIQTILAKVQKEASAPPAKEEPKKQEKQAPPQKKQQQQKQEKQAPKKEESKKRKQEDAQVSNSQKKNKKNKKK